MTISQTLLEVNASVGNNYIIRTLELTCDAWDSPVLICNGYEDQTVTDENGRVLTFTAANIGIELAAKNNKGNQALAFGVADGSGEVNRRTDTATEARVRVNAIYRTFLEHNTSAPQETPWHLTVAAVNMKGVIAQLQAIFFNMLGVAWPRNLYTTNVAPGLRWI